MVNIGAIAFFARTSKAIEEHQEKIISLLREEFSEHFKRLEDKQDKHNSVIERQIRLEGKVETMDEKIKVANHRLEDLEKV